MSSDSDSGGGFTLGGGGFTLGGKYGSQVASGKSTTDQNTTEVTKEKEAQKALNKELIFALETLISGGTGKTLKGTKESRLDIQNLINTLSTPIDSEYTKEAAVADSQQAVEALMQTIMAEGMGGVRDISNISGGYSSTVQEQARNDLITKAAGAGAKLQQDVVNRYAGIEGAREQTRLSALLGALSAMGEASVATEFEERSKGQKQQSDESIKSLTTEKDSTTRQDMTSTTKSRNKSKDNKFSFGLSL